jgi:hypothetical protein
MNAISRRTNAQPVDSHVFAAHCQDAPPASSHRTLGRLQRASVAVALSLASAACSVSSASPRVVSGGELDLLGLAGGDISPLRVVATRAVDSRVQPMVPVHLVAEGGNVAVTFAQRGRHQVVTRLNPASLEVVSSAQAGRSEAPAAPATGAARVALEGGRHVTFWTHENADGGRQVLAQMWTASGSRLGAPVVLSPADADVLGSPRAATTDGKHVLVTFAATADDSFELRAVSLEDGSPHADSVLTAEVTSP